MAADGDKALALDVGKSRASRTRLCCAGTGKQIHCFDNGTAKKLSSFPRRHSEHIIDLSFNYDGNLVMSGSIGGLLFLLGRSWPCEMIMASPCRRF